jgi:hypothetical protein
MASGWVGKLFAGGIGTLAEKIGEVADRFIQTKDEKALFQLQMEELLQKAASELEQTTRQELLTRERIMVAELTQGDNYTKRARPTIVYFGMVVIFLNYVLFPFLGQVLVAEFPEFVLPDGFWYAWGGAMSVWSIGRTMERRGAKNNLVGIVTGTDPRSKH